MWTAPFKSKVRDNCSKFVFEKDKDFSLWVMGMILFPVENETLILIVGCFAECNNHPLIYKYFVNIPSVFKNTITCNDADDDNLHSLSWCGSTFHFQSVSGSDIAAFISTIFTTKSFDWLKKCWLIYISLANILPAFYAFSKAFDFIDHKTLFVEW